MTAKDTFCRLITKTPANGNSVSSGGQTGFGAPASKRETRETRERKKDKKKICLLCRLGLRQGWLGWATFSWVFRPSPKAAKKEEVFSAGLTPPPPTPTLTFLHFPTRPSCTQHLATPFFFSATGNKHKIQRWRDAGPFPDVCVFSDFKVCGHYLHALRGYNLIQQSFVTLFCFFS